MCDDNDILRNVGGIQTNSLDKILQPCIAGDSDDEFNIEFSNLIKHSSYFSKDSFIATAKNIQNDFCIFSSSIESIYTSIDEIHIFVDQLRTHDFEFSIICFQECWIDDDVNTSLIDIPGYKCYAKGHTCGRKGACLFMYKNISQFKILLSLIIPKNCGRCSQLRLVVEI